MVQAGLLMGESLLSLERGKKVDQLAGKIFTFFFLFEKMYLFFLEAGRGNKDREVGISLKKIVSSLAQD